MFNNEIKLVNRTPSGRDARGQVVYTEEIRAALCEVVPISRDEYFRGAQVGINAEFKFLINPCEYNHEKVVEFNGRRYSVYREYETGPDELELYVEFVPGLNGGANNDS